jgi:hypothetical protein
MLLISLSACSLSGFLYFFCWHEHRIDTYRQRLFGVRDDLFDFAASGGIKFDDPAYTTLRDLSNGLIRFAHRLTFTRVWAIVLFGNFSRSNRMEAWMADVKSRPEAVRGQAFESPRTDRSRLTMARCRMVTARLICLLVALFVGLLKVRVRMKVVQGPRDISAVLEQEALEQSSLVEDDSCLAAV